MNKYKNYIPLHGHSTYSFGDGVAKIEEIVKKCKQIGAPAVGLTEHGNLASFYKFYKACKQSEINPVIGCEFYQNEMYFLDKQRFLQSKKSKTSKKDDDDKEDLNVDDYSEQNEEFPNNHFLSYATNYDGLKNLISLNNKSVNYFYRKPLVNIDMIFQTLDQNNVITTGCLASYFNKLILQGDSKQAEKTIQRFKQKFGNNFYFEIQFNELEQQNLVNSVYFDIYKKYNIKPVVGLDYHYINKQDWYIQYLLYVIKNRKTVRQYSEKDWFYSVRSLFIKTADQLYDSAKQYDTSFVDQCIKNTFEISQKTKILVPVYPDNFPKFTDDRQKSYQIFDSIVNEGLKSKVENGLINKDEIQKYQQRLNYEMNIIKDKNVSDYFLIVQDILRFVQNQGGSLGSGRGSAGGSLALYLSNITKVDPIKYDLIFERFLNPSRKDPADIDCLIDKTLVKTENGNKMLIDIQIGDKVFDINNNLMAVTNKHVRPINDNDIIYKITVKENNDFGFIILNSKHRLINEKQKEIKASQLIQLSSRILSYVNNNNSYSTVVLVQQIQKQSIKENLLVEIEVDQSQTFQIFPFS